MCLRIDNSVGVNWPAREVNLSTPLANIEVKNVCICSRGIVSHNILPAVIS